MFPELSIEVLYEGGFLKSFLAEHPVNKTVQWKESIEHFTWLILDILDLIPIFAVII